MSRTTTLASRLRTLQRRLQPRLKTEMWIPMGVCVIERDGQYCYANDEAAAIDERCKRLGVVPNIYVVSDEWNPDMDGCEV